MRSRTLTVGIALAVVGALLGAPAPARAEAPPSGCSPTIQVLPTVPGPLAQTSAVYGLSLLDHMAVGVSEGLPAYWVGDTLHQVPLPKGYTQGAVLAVNRFGLMVGYLRGASVIGGPAPRERAFRYWPGNPAVTFYPPPASLGGARAVDVNDAGHAVGWAFGPDVYTWDGVDPTLYEFGPGATIRRKLALPAGYHPSVIYYQGGDQRTYADLGINNSGFVVASGGITDERGSAGGSFTWTASSDRPTPVLPQHTLDGSGSAASGSSQVRAIDNRNHMIGAADGPSDPRFAMSWSSRTAPGVRLGLQVDERTGDEVEAWLVAMGDRSGIAAGTSFGYSRTSSPPDTALVWDGNVTHLIEPLPRLTPPGDLGDAGYSRAFAAQDDGRVGGWAEDERGRHLPIVWNCATGH